MAVRKRVGEVFTNAAGIDVGASSQWVAVPTRSCEEPVREFGAIRRLKSDGRLTAVVRCRHGRAGVNRGVLDTCA
jgi:hypothetical protein